jgi:hypothetical protein
MKKLLFTLAIAICIIATGNTMAQKPVKSTNFHEVLKVYETQIATYINDAFALQKTGITMDSTMKSAMITAIIAAIKNDMNKWKDFCLKNDKKEAFVLYTKPQKVFESECSTYDGQFALIQQEFIKSRFTWKEEDVKQFLTYKKIGKYVDEIVKKFKEGIVERIK